MSKVGFWLRGSKGKLGGSYLSKGPDGATVQHVIGEIKNPRSIAQMQQRMVMATAMAAYAGMKEIVDHSFEDITYGQPTMSEFIRLNAKMLREGLLSSDSTISFNNYQDRALTPNPYIISSGSLKKVPESVIVGADDSFLYVSWKFPFELTDTTRLRDFLSLLGLSVGGYITLLAIAYSEETKISQFGWVRLYPKQSELDSDMVGLQIDDLFEFESNVPVILERVFEDAESSVIVNFDFDQGGITHGSTGVINSDKKITWKRSSAKMTMMDDVACNPAAQALATYPIGTDYVLNGGNI